MIDYLIIGGGIIGTNIARELSKYDVKTLLLEKENDIANHQTLANSAIVHSCHDLNTSTLKGRLCIEGNKLYDNLKQELNIPLVNFGALVAATSEEEIKVLKTIEQQTINNGFVNSKILSFNEAKKIEPNLSDSVLEALHLPHVKVTYPWEVAFLCLENAINNGVSYEKNAKVTNINVKDNYYEVEINNKTFIKTKNIINSAGIFSKEILKMLNEDIGYETIPRKGEYFVLDKNVSNYVKHVIYPIPTKTSKGVLVVPQIHGNILVGPSNRVQKSLTNTSTSKEALNEIEQLSHKLIKDLPFHKTIRTFAGIRSSSTYSDFYIKESLIHKNIYHLFGMDSPGLTAAPAIARYLVEDVIKINAPKNPNFNPNLEKKTLFHKKDRETQLQLLKIKPLYGKIVCKCEKITKQEIIDALEDKIPSNTIKGIKKRVRAGSGTCQGGYCENEVLKIIAKHEQKSLDEINYYELNTPILVKDS